MTPEQRKMARHALGLPAKVVSYRNSFAAAPDTDIHAAWSDLEKRGLAKVGHKNAHFHMFHLTLAGAKEAAEPWEHLDPEDFPDAEQKDDGR